MSPHRTNCICHVCSHPVVALLVKKLAESEESHRLEAISKRATFECPECRANKAEATIKAMREWLDNNTTHYETAESEAPVLASVSAKIWYHATGDIESYPFSEMMDKALLEQS